MLKAAVLLMFSLPTFLCAWNYEECTREYEKAYKDWEKAYDCIVQLRQLPEKNDEKGRKLLTKGTELTKRIVKKMDEILHDIHSKPKKERKVRWRVRMARQCEYSKRKVEAHLQYMQHTLWDITVEKTVDAHDKQVKTLDSAIQQDVNRLQRLTPSHNEDSTMECLDPKIDALEKIIANYEKKIDSLRLLLKKVKKIGDKAFQEKLSKNRKKLQKTINREKKEKEKLTQTVNNLKSNRLMQRAILLARSSDEAASDEEALSRLRDALQLGQKAIEQTTNPSLQKHFKGIVEGIQKKIEARE